MKVERNGSLLLSVFPVITRNSQWMNFDSMHKNLLHTLFLLDMIKLTVPREGLNMRNEQYSLLAVMSELSTVRCDRVLGLWL